jgi:hypothetical protein
MHKGYYGINGNRLWLRGVLEPAGELDWIDLLIDSGPREPRSARSPLPQILRD